MNKETQSVKYIGLGVALGSSFGVTLVTIIGSITNDVGTWIGLGIPIGVSIGIVTAIIYSSIIKDKANIEKEEITK